MVTKALRRWQWVIGAVCLGVLIALATPGCASTAPTDPVVIEKPVPVPCKAPAVIEPLWALDTVQLTGDEATDLVVLWRAAEAEIEQRRGYEVALKAAVRSCQ